MKKTPDIGEISFPEIVEQPVKYGRNLHQTDRYKALVDSDTGKLFSIVSKTALTKLFFPSFNPFSYAIQGIEFNPVPVVIASSVLNLLPHCGQPCLRFVPCWTGRLSFMTVL